MKKFIKLIPAAIALVTLASCSQDDFLNKEASQNANNGKTMEASIENVTNITRAAFAENKNDAGKADKRALVWTSGDSYKVYGELTTPDKYTLQEASAGKANGTFDLKTDDYNENPAFAVFPYDKIDADRANSKLTVTLSDWTYKTAEVKDAGYNQGGFVSDVPMFGKIGSDPKSAAFGYMTALLRVDLQKLPKRTTRLILVTDRALTGTFVTDFDPAGDYPEIKSPAPVDADLDKSTDVDKDGNPENAYIMSVATDPVAQRTNKTFFIAVPTGNKYAKFDIYVEYNMGGSTQVEKVAELGNTARIAAGKSILKWERGKVKSLSKEITVTSTGNTPKQLAAFLKAEWKTFPADADINITVADGTGALAPIDLSTVADNTFEVPAEVQGRTINIIVDPSITEAFNTAGATMTIVDEDKAPVSSEPLRLINIQGATANGVVLALDCPETQIVLSAPDGLAATYAAPSKILVAEEAGLTICEDVTVGNLTITGGAVVNEGTTGSIRNEGDNDIKISGTTDFIKNLGTGAVTIEGTPSKKANIGGYITNGNGTKAAGKLTIKNAVLNGKTITNQANADKGVEIENVDEFKLNDYGKGAVSIKKVTTNLDDSNINAAASLTIEDIAKAGTVTYKGTGAFDAKTIKGAVTKFEATKASSYSVTDIQATITDLNYAGSGDATIAGNASKSPAVTNANIKGGKVDISNVKTNTNVIKTGKGALTITNSALGTVVNAGGTIDATGGTLGKKITSLTQMGAGKITLKGMQDVTTLTLSAAADIDYEDTFIATLNANYFKTHVKGTKASGIGKAINKGTTFSCETDVWNGSYKSTTLTNEIYTSASFAKLADGAGPTVDLFIDLDMGSKTFNGIATAINTFNGNAHKISNLKSKTGMFKNKSTSLLVNSLTLDGSEVTAKQAAGAIMGKAMANLTFNKVTVKNAKIGTSSDGAGTDQGIGGMIGEVDGTSATITMYNGLVENTTINGHYYMGGIIGKVTNAANINLYGQPAGIKTDLVGTKTTGLTFNPLTKDGSWSTLLSGTIAPFIGGIINLTTSLNIYGELTPVSKTEMEAWNWDKNFLSANETIKFKGTKRDDLNFIGYTNTSCPAFTYNLKLVSGFEANPSMTRRNTSATTTVLDTEYNCYIAY